jgi:hypothetical protein
MRKPSPISQRTIVRGACVLLALVACSTSSSGPVSSDSIAVAIPSTAAASSNSFGFAHAARDEAKLDGAAAPAREVGSQRTALQTRSTPPANATGSASAMDPSIGVPLSTVDPAGAMLVRHGVASVEVKTLDDAVSRIRQAAAQYGGFVANTAIRSGKDEQRSATLELRVPSAQFDAMVGALGQLGKVESVSVNAEDVAEEYVDLGARLANARRVEARLVELLATRTGKLSDVLTVEQELARVRQESERYDARIHWLERRVSLSSLDVSIHEKVPLLDTPRGHGPIAEAFAEAWTRFVGVVAWCIASLGILVPLGALALAGFAIARRMLGGGSPPRVSKA